MVFEQVRQHCGAGCAVAFAEEVFGRVPAVVLGEKAANKAVKGMGVLIGSPEGLRGVLPIMRLKPVPGASMKTRSETSSRLYWFSTILYGAAGSCWASVVVTRLGPKLPMWSHMVLEPGPPL